MVDSFKKENLDVICYGENFKSKMFFFEDIKEVFYFKGVIKKLIEIVDIKKFLFYCWCIYEKFRLFFSLIFKDVFFLIMKFF